MAQTARIAPLETGGAIVGTITRDRGRHRAGGQRARAAQPDRGVRAGARRSPRKPSRLKDEFLATLSHEIRTPLNAVLGWTRILRTQPVDARSLAHALEVIERNAASQLRLVEDLLDMARIISGKLRLETGPVDLARVAQAAIDVVAPAAAAKNVAHPCGVRTGRSADARATRTGCSRSCGTCCRTR